MTRIRVRQEDTSTGHQENPVVMETVLKCSSIRKHICGMMIRGVTGQEILSSDIFVRGLLNVTMRKVCVRHKMDSPSFL